MSPTLSVPTTPRPLSGDLRAAIDDAVKAIPAGKRGHVTAAATLEGLQVDAGVKPKGWLTVGGYAGKRWGQGWSAGAKATVTW